MKLKTCLTLKLKWFLYFNFELLTLNIQLFFIHLNRKTSRILSVNRIPKRCVLDLNSIRSKSFVVGLAGDLPNTVNKPAASKLRNEFILVRTCILFKYHHYSLNSSCCAKAKTYDVTPARDPALREPKAGVQSEKAGFPLEFIPHAMRGGNDKYCFRNSN